MTPERKRRRKYSINEDQRTYRELLFRARGNKYLQRRQQFFANADTNKMVKYLESTGIKQPYANNIAERFMTAAFEAYEKIKS